MPQVARINESAALTAELRACLSEHPCFTHPARRQRGARESASAVDGDGADQHGYLWHKAPRCRGRIKWPGLGVTKKLPVRIRPGVEQYPVKRSGSV